jgi:hypothetical protein
LLESPHFSLQQAIEVLGEDGVEIRDEAAGFRSKPYTKQEIRELLSRVAGREQSEQGKVKTVTGRTIGNVLIKGDIAKISKGPNSWIFKMEPFPSGTGKQGIIFTEIERSSNRILPFDMFMYAVASDNDPGKLLLRGVYLDEGLRGTGLLRPLSNIFFTFFPNVDETHPNNMNYPFLESLRKAYGFDLQAPEKPNAWVRRKRKEAEKDKQDQYKDTDFEIWFEDPDVERSFMEKEGNAVTARYWRLDKTEAPGRKENGWNPLVFGKPYKVMDRQSFEDSLNSFPVRIEKEGEAKKEQTAAGSEKGLRGFVEKRYLSKIRTAQIWKDADTGKIKARVSPGFLRHLGVISRKNPILAGLIASEVWLHEFYDHMRRRGDGEIEIIEEEKEANTVRITTHPENMLGAVFWYWFYYWADENYKYEMVDRVSAFAFLVHIGRSCPSFSLLEKCGEITEKIAENIVRYKAGWKAGKGNEMSWVEGSVLEREEMRQGQEILTGALAEVLAVEGIEIRREEIDPEIIYDDRFSETGTASNEAGLIRESAGVLIEKPEEKDADGLIRRIDSMMEEKISLAPKTAKEKERERREEEAIRAIKFNERVKIIQAKQEKQIKFIAIDTSWIKGYEKRGAQNQFEALNPLISAIRRYCGKNDIQFIGEDRETVLREIGKIKKADPSIRGIVLGSEETIDMLGLDNDENIFLAGVNGKEISEGMYIRIMEMLTLSMDLFMSESISESYIQKNHPLLGFSRKQGIKNRITFEPAAEKITMTVEELKALYRVQIAA